MKSFLPKITLLLIVSICSIFLLPSCSSDDDISSSNNEKFRSRFNGTTWEIDGVAFRFSSDKLFYVNGDIDGNDSCACFEEGSTNNFEYDGCIYDKVTDVVIEEDREKLVIREIWTSGTPTEQSSNCSAGEGTLTFKALGDNAISFFFDNNPSESYTLIKSNKEFLTNNCLKTRLMDL